MMIRRRVPRPMYMCSPPRAPHTRAGRAENKPVSAAQTGRVAARDVIALEHDHDVPFTRVRLVNRPVAWNVTTRLPPRRRSRLFAVKRPFAHAEAGRSSPCGGGPRNSGTCRCVRRSRRGSRPCASWTPGSACSCPCSARPSAGSAATRDRRHRDRQTQQCRARSSSSALTVDGFPGIGRSGYLRAAP